MNAVRVPKLIVGAVAMLFLGLIFAWSLFVAPIEADLGFTRTQTSLVFTISMSCYSIGNLVGSQLIKRTSPRVNMLVSAVLLLAGFFLCSNIQSLAGIYLSYGVVASLGIGFSYIAIVNVVTRWFPDRVGTASGTLMMGFGLGSLVLGGFASSLIGQYGWRNTFFGFGVAFAVIMALASIVMSLPGSDVPFPAKKAAKQGQAEQGLELTPGQMLKRVSFWMFFLWCVMMLAAGLATIGHAATFAATLGAATSVTVMATGVVSISNGLGRIAFGTLFDMIGKRACLLVDSILFVAGMLLLSVAAMTGTMPLLFVGYVCAGLAYGGVPTMNASVINSFYGTQNYSINFSITSLSLIPGALLGPYFGGMLMTQTGSYVSTFVALLLASGVALVIGFFVRKP